MMSLRKLYLVPNLLGMCPPSAVLPARTIAVAKSLRHFACETPKAARAFLKTLEMPVAISELQICEIPATQTVENWLRAGHDVGVVSDAGCPGTADPGALLVTLAHRLGVRVVPLVGPSSILLALMASGLNGQTFRFHGYLPSDAAARIAVLKQLDSLVQKTGETQAFIETPYRNGALLQAIKNACNAQTTLCCARALTTEQERIVSQSLAMWSAQEIADFSIREPALFLIGRAQ
jgi:16S rRNA (cytidine1402-2'-O)-methyltransferase